MRIEIESQEPDGINLTISGLVFDDELEGLQFMQELIKLKHKVSQEQYVKMREELEIVRKKIEGEK